MKTLKVTEKIDKYNCTYYEFVEHNEKKFLITILMRNGFPLGFNDNCCVKVMTDNGFVALIDSAMIDAPYKNDYTSQREDVKRSIVYACRDEFKKMIKKLY